MKIDFKIVLKILAAIFCAVFILFLALFCYFFAGVPPKAEKIEWGINFSQKHAENLGLNWKEVYSALFDDLAAKKIKIATYWDLLEPAEGLYSFGDLDWQISEAEKRGAEIILVIGMKTPRWPECHIPDWAKNLNGKERQEKILNLIRRIVLNYGDSTSIVAWQVENEPFFPFGICPKLDKNLLKEEIALVKSLDPHTITRTDIVNLPAFGDLSSFGAGVDFQKRPVIISDTGEWSFWRRAAKLGDIVGITMYKKVWFAPTSINRLWGIEKPGFYSPLPFPAIYYYRRAQLIKKLFNKEVIVVELQAEPWGPLLLYDLTLEEQQKSMDIKQFRKNIDFAKKSGFDKIYLWGAEWWYWMKEKQNMPEIWEEAKKLF